MISRRALMLGSLFSFVLPKLVNCTGRLEEGACQSGSRTFLPSYQPQSCRRYHRLVRSMFRPGKWVILDSQFASANMDSKSDLSGVYLDIPGLLYQSNDSKNQVIDTTYTVADLELTKVPSAPGA